MTKILDNLGAIGPEVVSLIEQLRDHTGDDAEEQHGRVDPWLVFDSFLRS